jgi:hypothetical protein
MDSAKVLNFLKNLQVESEGKIKKLKRRYKLIKILYAVTIILSIGLSIVVSSSLIGIPILVVSILGTIGVLITALSIKFDIEGTKHQLKHSIMTLDKIKNRLQYLLECNGSITETKIKDILDELHFN